MLIRDSRPMAGRLVSHLRLMCATHLGWTEKECGKQRSASPHTRAHSQRSSSVHMDGTWAMARLTRNLDFANCNPQRTVDAVLGLWERKCAPPAASWQCLFVSTLRPNTRTWTVDSRVQRSAPRQHTVLPAFPIPRMTSTTYIES